MECHGSRLSSPTLAPTASGRIVLRLIFANAFLGLSRGIIIIIMVTVIAVVVAAVFWVVTAAGAAATALLQLGRILISVQTNASYT